MAPGKATTSRLCQISVSDLPSELCRQIVAYLAPSTKFPGSKEDLKAANLTHRNLREWVPEYMFHDMTLKHVREGMTSQLELFAISPENAGLLKYVKHIVVQVPPAIRWDARLGIVNPQNMLDETRRRVADEFSANDYENMTYEQQNYCGAYHMAMVEPFCGSWHWEPLHSFADATWGQVFAQFNNLSKISVDVCERFDMPWGTRTHAFVKQYGKAAESEIESVREDSSVNLAWASSVIVNRAPPSVKSLELSMANIDRLNVNSVVCRLLMQAAKPVPNHSTCRSTTHLTLNIGGIEGLHGDSNFRNIGSMGGVQFWSDRLNMFTQLKTLELRNEMMPVGSFLAFSNGARTDRDGCILSWLIPRLTLPQLTDLTLSGFTMDVTDLVPMLDTGYAALVNLHINSFCLRVVRSQPTEMLADPQGKVWCNAMDAIIQNRPRLRTFIRTPAISRKGEHARYKLHAYYARKLCKLPGLNLECRYDEQSAAALENPFKTLV